MAGWAGEDELLPACPDGIGNLQTLIAYGPVAVFTINKQPAVTTTGAPLYEQVSPSSLHGIQPALSFPPSLNSGSGRGLGGGLERGLEFMFIGIFFRREPGMQS
jgi:hypothetical protein